MTNFTGFPCAPGFWCPPGMHESSPSHFPCSIGHYCAGNNARPVPCRAATYQDEIGQSQVMHGVFSVHESCLVSNLLVFIVARKRQIVCATNHIQESGQSHLTCTVNFVVYLRSARHACQATTAGAQWRSSKMQARATPRHQLWHSCPSNAPREPSAQAATQTQLHACPDHTKTSLRRVLASLAR